MTPTLICVALTPVPSEVSFGTADTPDEADPPGVVGFGLVALLALLLHAPAMTAITTAAARVRRRARIVSRVPSPLLGNVLVRRQRLPVAERRQRRVERLQLERVVEVVLARGQRRVGTPASVRDRAVAVHGGDPV